LNNLWPRWRPADNCSGSVRGRNRAQKEERARKLITKARKLFRNAKLAGSFIEENATKIRGLVLYARSRDILAGNAQRIIRNQRRMTRRRINCEVGYIH
jgi:hypothetical protein